SAIVLVVWEPPDVGPFFPGSAVPADETVIDALREGAEETAAEGVALAEAAGFRAEAMATPEAPAWRRIVDAADECDAGLIVLGSAGHTGLSGVLLGSVAGGVAQHSRRSVLTVHR